MDNEELDYKNKERQEVIEDITKIQCDARYCYSNCYISVSYTHLDVYKRQVLDIEKMIKVYPVPQI